MERSWGFQEVEVPRFQDNRHMKVVRFSALPTGRIYPNSYSRIVLNYCLTTSKYAHCKEWEIRNFRKIHPRAAQIVRVVVLLFTESALYYWLMGNKHTAFLANKSSVSYVRSEENGANLSRYTTKNGHFPLSKATFSCRPMAKIHCRECMYVPIWIFRKIPQMEAEIVREGMLLLNKGLYL